MVAPGRAGEDDTLDSGRSALIQQNARDRVELAARRADVVWENNTLNVLRPQMRHGVASKLAWSWLVPEVVEARGYEDVGLACLLAATPQRVMPLTPSGCSS